MGMEHGNQLHKLITEICLSFLTVWELKLTDWKPALFTQAELQVRTGWALPYGIQWKWMGVLPQLRNECILPQFKPFTSLHHCAKLISETWLLQEDFGAWPSKSSEQNDRLLSDCWVLSVCEFSINSRFCFWNGSAQRQSVLRKFPFATYFTHSLLRLRLSLYSPTQQLCQNVSWFCATGKYLQRTGLATEIICSIYLNKFLNLKLPRIKEAHAIKEKQKAG